MTCFSIILLLLHELYRSKINRQMLFKLGGSLSYDTRATNQEMRTYILYSSISGSPSDSKSTRKLFGAKSESSWVIQGIWTIRRRSWIYMLYFRLCDSRSGAYSTSSMSSRLICNELNRLALKGESGANNASIHLSWDSAIRSWSRTLIRLIKMDSNEVFAICASNFDGSHDAMKEPALIIAANVFPFSLWPQSKKVWYGMNSCTWINISAIIAGFLSYFRQYWIISIFRSRGIKRRNRSTSKRSSLASSAERLPSTIDMVWMLATDTSTVSTLIKIKNEF